MDKSIQKQSYTMWVLQVEGYGCILPRERGQLPIVQEVPPAPGLRLGNSSP